MLFLFFLVPVHVVTVIVVVQGLDHPNTDVIARGQDRGRDHRVAAGEDNLSTDWKKLKINQWELANVQKMKEALYIYEEYFNARTWIANKKKLNPETLLSFL